MIALDVPGNVSRHCRWVSRVAMISLCGIARVLTIGEKD